MAEQRRNLYLGEDDTSPSWFLPKPTPADKCAPLWVEVGARRKAGAGPRENRARSVGRGGCEEGGSTSGLCLTTAVVSVVAGGHLE